MVDRETQAPQFHTAEYSPQPSGMNCAACRLPVGNTYFQIRGAPVCAACAEQIRAKIPVDSHAAFARAVVFGVGGAVLGLAIYVAFALGTGLISGLVSLAVGYIVGKAMHLGSRGVGGRRYQIVAVLLTYFAVSMSAVQIALHQYQGHHTQSVQSADATAQSAETPPVQPVGFGKAIGELALLGLGSPFLELQDPVHGVIGMIILLVGMRFAWRFTADRSVQVSGPHAAAVPASAG